MGLCLVAMIYALLFTIIGINSAVAYVKNVQPHHVIFDDLGKMSTGVTYINIAIPLNITILYEQIAMFSDYLDKINTFNSSTSTPYDVATNIYGFRIKETDKISMATEHNMVQLTKQLASYAKKRLTNLSWSLRSLDNLLPTDPAFELTNERHKRFVFMIPMIICEVNKSYWKDQHLGAVNKMSEIYKELELYKQEYARLYNETLPELIPEYIEDNHDAMDEETLNTHVDYLQRTKRDVQFLINIIKSKDNSTFTPIPVPKNPTTPNPFRNFSNLYTNHKKQPISSTFMKPGTTSQQHKEQLIKGRGTLQEPLRKKLTNIDRKVFTHSEIVDLDIPYPIRNRTKRFLPAAAMAAGALGTFLGIFNSLEINNLRRDMATMSNNQNLLIQVQKIHTEQILQLEVSIMQMNQVFQLYLKNNPALLYAKLEDVLQSLADRMGNLKDTMQMLQLQRLSTNTLTSFQLTNLYNEVIATAKANNLQLLTNKPQDLFQLDTSYLRVNNEILVLVHVPCSNPSSLLTIYKYVPFPIPVLPNFNANTTDLNTIQDVFDISSPIANNALEGIHFQADADLIAIGKNDKGRHRYILLSSAEMSACTKRSNAFMCERHQVTKSDLLGSCLGSLYLQSPLGVANNCKINRIPLKETVYQISNTNHIVFTPYPITTQISCFNGSYFPLKIKHTQQVRIPEGCSVELTNHTITSDFSIRITSDSVHFEWDFDPISLPNSAKLMLDAKSMDSKLKFIEKTIEKVKMGDIHARGFENLMVDHVSSGSWLGTTFIVCFVITGILAILTAVICARNYLLARGWIGTRSGPPNHPRDFNVSYHRDRGIFDGEEEEQELSRIIRRPSGHRTGTHSTTTSRETPPPFIHLVTPSAPEN